MRTSDSSRPSTLLTRAARSLAAGLARPAVRVAECGEPLVELTRYGFVGASSDVAARLYARREVAERLVRIQDRELAPRGYRWLILNAWRSREALTIDYVEHWKRTVAVYPGLDLESVRAEVEAHIEAPDLSDVPPALSTGGAIDLGLWDVQADRPADLGAAPDEPSPRAALRWFESADAHPDIRERRRLIADSLALAGFVGAPDKVWHWEFGTPRWAQVTGALHAAYGEAIAMLEPSEGGPAIAGAAFAADEATAVRESRIAALGCRCELVRWQPSRAMDARRSPGGWGGLSLGLRAAT